MATLAICSYRLAKFKTPGSLQIALSVHKKIYTGCSGNIVFFHNSLQPLPRLHRCKRPSKLSAQCECTVSLIGWTFFVQPIGAECWRGRGGKPSRILGKNTIFNEHPVYCTFPQVRLLVGGLDCRSVS